MGYGKLFGVTVRDARFPLGWAVAPGRRGELRLTDAGAQASRGRLTAQANLRWGESARLEGQARFSAIDIGELLSHYTESKVVAGLATGRVDFGGQNMRSVKDVTARVDAKLAQAVPSQTPVFRQVMPFLVPGIGANVRFDSGDLRGVLGGGVFRLEQLTLIGELARVYAEGSVTVDHQRLNLNVVANTKQLGMDPAVMQMLGLALPAFGPIPLGVLNQATGYLSNRTIRLTVTGTVKAPSIQVNPAALLSESAVRFFIAQSGVPIPSAALQAPGP
jgi:translocation and assembly module TamB